MGPCELGCVFSATSTSTPIALCRFPRRLAAPKFQRLAAQTPQGHRGEPCAVRPALFARGSTGGEIGERVRHLSGVALQAQLEVGQPVVQGSQ